MLLAIVRNVVVLAAVLVTARTASAQDFKQYVGKSPCEPGIQSEYGVFSLRLDKAQQLELLERYSDKTQVVFIVQPTKDPRDVCGVIRDAIQITQGNTFDENGKHFEFRCFEADVPTAVVVGIVTRDTRTLSLAFAAEAWRIDLKAKKFVRTHTKVVCSDDGWDGDDNGGDMVDDAKLYAAHGKPGQFGPESK